jgi:prepilin peptidase CpaA
MNAIDHGTLVLLVLLSAAALGDIRTHRISNALVVFGTISGIAFGFAPGGIGIAGIAGGLATGFALLLPFYALRIMGAGDVKLMAMTGIYLGATTTLVAALATFVAGGLLAIIYGLKAGTLPQALQNVRAFAYGSALRIAGTSIPGIGELAVTRTRIPYAVAVAAGVVAALLARYYSTNEGL